MRPLTLGHVRILRVMQRHAGSLACNKGDYSWFLQSEERIKEASGYCEIVQSSTKSVFCVVYIAADCTTTQPRKSFRTLTQVGCSYNKCNIDLG